MNFILRDLETIASELTLEQVVQELESHKAVVNKIARRVLQKKVEHNIVVLQMRKAELQRRV